MSEYKKIEVHPDFEKWYNEIKKKYFLEESQKAKAIVIINQMGFGFGLLDSRKNDVSGDYPQLRDEMQTWKDKYTRAVLDGYTLREEKKFYVRFPHVEESRNYLNVDLKDLYCILTGKDETKQYKTKLTLAEIKKIDARYLEFAEPVVGVRDSLGELLREGLNY